MGLALAANRRSGRGCSSRSGFLEQLLRFVLVLARVGQPLGLVEPLIASATHLGKYRDCGDLVGSEPVPRQAAWSLGRAAFDDSLWCHDQVDAEVVVVFWQVLVEYLEFVHGGHDDCLVGQQAGLGQQGDLDIGVS